MSLETEKVAGVSRIGLYIGSTEISDTGNYTCVTDTDKTETVLLVVTQGRLGYSQYSRPINNIIKLISLFVVNFTYP